MTGKTFLNRIANGQTDFLALLLDLLEQVGAGYCVIGGLAVNAYAEPVVSLDLGIVIVTDKVQALCEAASHQGIKIERFERSIDLSIPGSDLRVQIQTDPRYQEFIPRAVPREVLGYRMTVAALEDVLRGKIWAYRDERRRRSKRQKDLADILRVIETHPQLSGQVPPEIRSYGQ